VQVVEAWRLWHTSVHIRPVAAPDEARPAAQCDGNQGPLAHAAGELERVSAHALLGARYSDAIEKRDAAPPGLALAHVVVQPDRFDETSPSLSSIRVFIEAP